MQFKLDKIPKGSRLEKYLNELSKFKNKNTAEILAKMLIFSKNTFIECLDFLKQNAGIKYLPQIVLKLVPNHEQFKKHEEEESKRVASREIARTQASAFVVGNRFQMRLYIDFESFVSLLEFGYPTFVINLVMTYVHEILHMAFPEKLEQGIYDLECSLVESFLGIELPKEIKNVKASDYYQSHI